MKGNLKSVLNLAKELKNSPMEMFIKVNILMEGRKELVNIFGRMEATIKENSKMV